MSRKKTPRSGDERARTEPSDSPGSAAATNVTDPPRSTAMSAESDAPSAEAIFSEEDARPPDTEAETKAEVAADGEAAAGGASVKEYGSRTLMGFRLDGLSLAGLRASAEEQPSEFEAEEKAEEKAEATTEEKTPEEQSAGTSTVENKASGDGDDEEDPPVLDGERTLVVEAKMLTRPSSTSDTQVTSLLEEVAQALDLQASEYRDRARGKLPGMSAPSPAAPLAVLGSSDLEFEDADEPTALTPGDKSAAEGTTRNERAPIGGRDVDADDEAVVLGPASSSKSPAAGTDGRSGRFPPIPGLSGPAAAGPVGPHPGATRSATPTSGLSLSSSGRVRLPTPPGSNTIPPPSGRLSLPPGMMTAPVIPGRLSSMSLDSAGIAAAREASRRVSASAAASGSGRASKGRMARVTQPVLQASRQMPAVLAAHVKIATVSLAGLIAVTFAGGLLVGMLVWRGQGRAGVEPVAATAPTGAESGAPSTAPGLAGPAKVPTGVVMPVGATGLGAGAASGAPRGPAGPGIATEAIVTPIAAEAAAAETAPPPPPRRAMATAPRVRRPTPAPATTDTAALFPKAPTIAKPVTPAPAAAAKTVASNAPTKAAPKSKAKTTWHDPFAD